MNVVCPLTLMKHPAVTRFGALPLPNFTKSHINTLRGGRAWGTSYIGDLLLIQERRGWQVFLRCLGSQSLLLGEAHVA